MDHEASNGTRALGCCDDIIVAKIDDQDWAGITRYLDERVKQVGRDRTIDTIIGTMEGYSKTIPSAALDVFISFDSSIVSQSTAELLLNSGNLGAMDYLVVKGYVPDEKLLAVLQETVNDIEDSEEYGHYLRIKRWLSKFDLQLKVPVKT